MWLEKCGPKNEIFDCLSSTSVFDLYGLDRWEFGYVSVFTESFRSHPTTQVLIDLLIAGGILTLIMIFDNHRKGRSFKTV